MLYIGSIRGKVYFIPVGITEDVVKLVACKLSGIACTGGTDSEALQGWLLKFREDRKKLRISVKYFVDWLANKIPPWADYWAFMSGRLIFCEKKPGVRLVGVGENWVQYFTKCVLKAIRRHPRGQAAPAACSHKGGGPLRDLPGPD